MNEETSMTLDADELLQLAMADIQLGHHDEAIKKLKFSLALNADNANAYYLLAAEHAEIGLFDRAISEMTRAVELDPKLATAHFQLGLLYFSQDRIEEAKRSWSYLESLDNVESLIAFRNAFLHLLEDRLDQSVNELTVGILKNVSNPALNRDMQRVVGNLQQRLKEHPQSSEKSSDMLSNNVLLSTYRDQAD